MVKNKYWTHGGSRSGAGRPHKWKHSKTKVVRLPAVFVDHLLVLAHYMDDNDGELPFIPQLFLFVMVCLIRQGRIDIFDISRLF
jgi:hypothetical protein